MPKTEPKKEGSIKVKPLDSDKKHFDIRRKHPHRKPRRLPSLLMQFTTMVGGVLLVLLMITLYTNGRMVWQSTRAAAQVGIEQLKAATEHAKASNWSEAKAQFQVAEKTWLSLTDQTNEWLQAPPSGIQTRSITNQVDQLLQSAVTLSEVGQELIDLKNRADELKNTFAQTEQKPTDRLRQWFESVEGTRQKLSQVTQNLHQIRDRILPEPLKTTFLQARTELDELETMLTVIQNKKDPLLHLMGDRTPHRYLVLLQNNHERRPTGGFIGSFLIIDVNDGQIEKLQPHDVYVSDAQLRKVIEAPAGINLVADRLYLRDANLNPDFPTSAQLIMDLLEYSQGPSVDTVIAIDQTVTEALLKYTGPIKIPRTPFTITADSFNDIMSFYIESKQPYTETPKQILIDFIPLFKERVLALEDKMALAPDLIRLVKTGHIQAYSSYEDVQTLFDDWLVSGRMLEPQKKTDFLSVVTTSVGGNKSDAFIKTDLTHQTVFSEDGVITDQLTIQKAHQWNVDKFAPWQRWADFLGTGTLDLKTLQFIHGAGDNKDYLRVYVPKGSYLTKVDGIDRDQITVTQSNGYTVFEWLYVVSAGNQKSVTLTYRLPFELSGNRYRMMAQHQAGAENVWFKKTLTPAANQTILRAYPDVNLTEGTPVEFNQNQVILAEIH